ncbi:nectin-2 isoform X2 [Kryptolebias marmoratus]|uniref:Si:ch73-22o12.1 n=1 Tax=Kryptolebias marmoratus TaxID=37003 RepID=A0A3Q3AN58_KRYMA|nr:nectin-2 isoform X2 [Kryptolebias marmoratus]
MARNDGPKMIGLLLCFVASILHRHGASGQRVKVDPEVLSYPGQTVNLRCSFADATGVQLTMVTWIYEPTDGERQNIAVFHPNFEPSYPDSPVKGRVSFTRSPPDMNAPSIQITDVRLTDGGKYICEYATYPSGNEQGITQLVMLAKPKNSASIVTVNASTQSVVVARCESANGRPPATIKWITTVNGEEKTKSKPGTDDTETVISEYHLVPKSSDNGKDISCSVEHRTQVNPESIPLKLAVQFPPEVTINGYDKNWYLGRTNVVLTCDAKANPVPFSVKWNTMSGELPATVQAMENELRVLKVDEFVNTTFVCEVKNRIGTTKEQIAVFVRVNRLPEKGPATGSIIGGIIAVILVLAIIGTAIAMWRKHKNKKFGDRPPKYKPPPPQKANSSVTTKLNQSYVPEEVSRSVPNEYDYSQSRQEPVTDLDAYLDDDNNNDSDDDGGHDGEHYFPASRPGWDDPGNSEILPPYRRPDSVPQDYNGTPNVSRGESFVSTPMIV